MTARQPAIVLLVFVVVGIVLADQTALGGLWFLGLGIILAVAATMTLAQKSRTIPLLLFMLCLGSLTAFHYAHRYVDPGPRNLGKVITEKVACRIWGEVTDWPDYRANRIEIKIAVDSILTAGEIKLIDGALLIKVSDTANLLQRGDRVDFWGRIYPLSSIRASSTFDYGRYLSRKGLFGIVYLPTLIDVKVDRRLGFGLFSLVDRIREALVGSLSRNLEPEQTALARGFLIGETRDIPAKIYKMFRDSGTLHLLAVSGSNVSLVLIFFIFIFRPFNITRRRRSLYLLIIVILFTQLAYEEPSVVRAAVMASLILIATVLERRYELNQIIAVAALVILLADPAQLYDVGFQLSFVTAWGLIITGTVLKERLRPSFHRWYSWWLALLVGSLTAQIFSAPIIALYFERIPAISVLANLLIIPLVSVGVIGVLVLLVADLIWPMLGLLVGGVVNLILKLVIWVLQLLGGEEMIVWKTGALLSGPEAPWLIVIVYIVLVIAVLSIEKIRFRRFALIGTLVLLNIGLALAAIRVNSDNQSALKLTTVPGGVMLLLPSAEPDRPDLVFSSLRASTFPIDERIVAPWLERNGIEKINRLFILSADYSTLPAVIRTANQFEAREFFVAPDLSSAMTDQYRLLPELPTWVWQPLNHSSSSLTDIGFHPTKYGLQVVLETGTIIITPNMTAELVSLRDQPEMVIIGQRWQPKSIDWIKLSTAGQTTIVCSKIEQPYKFADSTGIRADSVKPDYLIDLSQVGSLEINPKTWEISDKL